MIFGRIWRPAISSTGIPKRSMGHPFNGFDVLVHRGKSELEMAQGTLLSLRLLVRALINIH